MGQTIKIKVPATSANLAVGFDTLGLAVNLFNMFEFELNTNEVVISGCPNEYCGKDNMVYQAYLHGCKCLNSEPINFHLTIKADIPTTRGLGSSASCVVAGVTLAYYLKYKKINKEEIAEISLMIEKHPDNVMAAVFGGLISAYYQNKWEHLDLPINNNISLIALIPDYEVSTNKAREILPSSLTYQDCVNNLQRILPLIIGLEKLDYQLISSGLTDRLHEPYRYSLIKDNQNIQSILQKNDFLYFISGSGSTIMLIEKPTSNYKELEKQIPQNNRLLRLSINKEGVELYE